MRKHNSVSPTIDVNDLLSLPPLPSRWQLLLARAILKTVGLLQRINDWALLKVWRADLEVRKKG